MNQKLILGIDLGGTKLAYKLVSGTGVLASAKVKTHVNFEKQLNTVYESLQTEFGPVDVVSIGVPGPVANGIMGPSFPLGTLKNIDVSKFFSNCSKIIVRNDMQMAAYAELINGDGRNYRNFCLVSMSTGIGVAVVVNANVLDIRCEFGHQIIMNDTEQNWSCLGHQNCWASVCSGTAIKHHGFSSKHYPFIKQVNAIAFANIVCAYDPQVIFVMGGVGTNLFSEIVPKKNDIADKINLRPLPLIKISSFSQEIGVTGAIALANVMEKAGDQRQ